MYAFVIEGMPPHIKPPLMYTAQPEKPYEACEAHLKNGTRCPENLNGTNAHPEIFVLGNIEYRVCRRHGNQIKAGNIRPRIS